MKDVFYTILVVWIIWRIVNSFNSYNNNRGQRSNNYNDDNTQEGKTTIKHTPAMNKKISDDEGEYVDYEEIK